MILLWFMFRAVPCDPWLIHLHHENARDNLSLNGRFAFA